MAETQLLNHFAQAPDENVHAVLIYKGSKGNVVRKNVYHTTTLIGSHDSANLQLISPKVSPTHCVITTDGRGFRIWDLRSETGVYVNDYRVKSARLKNQDRIKIGPFTFLFDTNYEDQSRQGFFIDDYRVQGILGTGGMGWLYVVEDPRTMERYALKVLMRKADHPRVEDGEMKARFHLENEAASQLNHPHIVKVIDCQMRSDVEYMLMELFQSITLQELIARDEKVGYPLACSIASQTALALQHIHDSGSIHRDVKPANILIGKDGYVKLCDFGLVFLGSHDLEKELAEQMGNDCLGTADYISPEQSRDSYKIDHRADIYSLGCALFLSLTGQLPFPRNNNREKIIAHRKEAPPSLRRIAPEIPEEISQIVDRCLEKDPDLRFQSALQLSESLTPYARDMPVDFNFEQLLKERTDQAKFRLADPKRKHHLDRIPANVASSMQMYSSHDRMEQEQTIISQSSTGSAARDLGEDSVS